MTHLAGIKVAHVSDRATICAVDRLTQEQAWNLKFESAKSIHSTDPKIATLWQKRITFSSDVTNRIQLLTRQENN